MRLDIDCTWNEKKERGKVVICFDPLPKTLFSMPLERVVHLQRLMNHPQQHMEEIKSLYQKHSKSLYSACAYLQALKIDKKSKAAEALLEEMRQKYPSQPFIECIEAAELLEQGRLIEFFQKFKGIDVLKGAFKKRRVYYFEEALFFHTLWAKYYREVANLTKYQKHQQFLALIHHTLQSKRII